MYRFSRITLIIGLCNKSNVASDHCSSTNTQGVWVLSMKVSSLIERQICDHYDAYCGRKVAIDDRDGGQNELIVVTFTWGGGWG